MKLPVGWTNARIGELCKLINGMAFKPSDWSASGLPIIRIQNLNRPDAEFNYFDGQVAEKFVVEPGELLFAWSGTPGTSFGAHIWRGKRAVLNQHIFRVRFEEKDIDKSFFKLAINAKLNELIGKAHGGVGLAHVTKGKFEQTEIVLPPLAEQRRIVAKLDALFARSVRARVEIEKALRLRSRARAAILKSFLSEGVARNWAHVTVEEIMTEGQIGLVRSKEEQLQTGVPYIRMNHFNLEGRWNEEKLTFVSCTPEEKERFSLKQGDVLFNTRNSVELVGKVAIWPRGKEGYVFNNNLLRMRFRDGVFPDYVALIMMSPAFQEQLAQHKSATTSVAAIYLRNFYKMRIPLPSLEEQMNVVEGIRRALGRLENLTEEASRSRALLDRLEAALLTKAFKGELVPQDLNDEPASVLLERIKFARAQELQSQPKRGRKLA